MTDIVAAILFAGFLLGILLVTISRRLSLPGLTPRRGVSLFLAWSLAASFAPGLAQRDAWPFASWPLVASIQPEWVTHPRLVAVDAGGEEHLIDARAWEPLSLDELAAWLSTAFQDLPGEDRDRAASWLLYKAEAARSRAREGNRPGTFGRILGPLAAPLFLLHPRLWDDPGSVPARPFTGLRLYKETWKVEARAAGKEEVRRELIYAFHEGDLR